MAECTIWLVFTRIPILVYFLERLVEKRRKIARNLENLQTRSAERPPIF